MLFYKKQFKIFIFIIAFSILFLVNLQLTKYFWDISDINITLFMFSLFLILLELEIILYKEISFSDASIIIFSYPFGLVILQFNFFSNIFIKFNTSFQHISLNQTKLNIWWFGFIFLCFTIQFLKLLITSFYHKEEKNNLFLEKI